MTTPTPKCGGSERHRRRYGLGAWWLGGWVSGTHECPCGGDARIYINVEAGGEGVESLLTLSLCLVCAKELRDGLDCEIDAGERE